MADNPIEHWEWDLAPALTAMLALKSSEPTRRWEDEYPRERWPYSTDPPKTAAGLYPSEVVGVLKLVRHLEKPREVCERLFPLLGTRLISPQELRAPRLFKELTSRLPASVIAPFLAACGSGSVDGRLSSVQAALVQSVAWTGDDAATPASLNELGASVGVQIPHLPRLVARDSLAAFERDVSADSDWRSHLPNVNLVGSLACALPIDGVAIEVRPGVILDRQRYVRLIANAVSFNGEERFDILATKTPTLSQWQVDRLAEIFDEERSKFSAGVESEWSCTRVPLRALQWLVVREQLRTRGNAEKASPGVDRELMNDAAEASQR